MPRPRPIEENPLNRLRERPYLAGDAVEKTWSFCWPTLTVEQSAEQAARLAEFFAAEVVRIEETS
jgi:hypothetical protein